MCVSVSSCKRNFLWCRGALCIYTWFVFTKYCLKSSNLRVLQNWFIERFSTFRFIIYWRAWWTTGIYCSRFWSWLKITEIIIFIVINCFFRFFLFFLIPFSCFIKWYFVTYIIRLACIWWLYNEIGLLMIIILVLIPQ